MDLLVYFFYYFSWGQYLLYGLRGVKLDFSYCLMVFFVYFINKDFGFWDKGMEGINSFFRNYNCIDICYGWLKFDIMDINMNIKDIDIFYKSDQCFY